MIIQRRVCNVCFHRNGSHVDSTVKRKVTIDKRSTELDLCDDDDVLLTETTAVFFESGVRVAARTRRPKVEAEPEPEPENFTFECNCGRSFATQRGLTRHVNFPPQESIEEHEAVA